MSRKPAKLREQNKNRKAFDSGGSRSGITQAEVGEVGPAKTGMTNYRRWYLIAVFLIIALGGTYLAQFLKGIPDVERYGYKIVKRHPHDPEAFTQGLVVKGDVVWESTGKYSQSQIRKVDLESGKILKKSQLPDDQFGEGLARVGDRLYQLTWKKGICHVYDLELNWIEELNFTGQGWGLTYDGRYLIMSDGTSRLRFIDPETFQDEKVVTVKFGRQRINYLNELEFTGGKIYANRWQSDNVYAIDPATGNVTAIIDLRGLWDWSERPDEGVLNGIAVDSAERKILVTGKYCPHIFEIELVPQR